MQQVVRLLGDLGERYGVEHVYHNLRTPADAIKLLCINYPSFQAELVTAHEKGIGYRVLQAGVDLDLDDLHLPIGQNDLILTPVLSGADDNPITKVIAGVALVAAAIVFAPAGAGFLGLGAGVGGATGTFAAAASVAVGSIGASLVLGGVTQMLSPQPEFGLGAGVGVRNDFQATRPESVNRGFDGQQSYAYLGAQNTVGVGATIPVAYGKVLVGSHVISADVDVADESDPLKKATRTPGIETVTVNGEKLRNDRRVQDSGRWGFIHFGRDYTGGDIFRTFNKSDKITFENQIRLEFTEGPTKSPDHYFIAIELTDFFKFVSGPGTTKTDAFISYQIQCRENQDENSVTARDSFTVQGLVTGTYKYYHKFKPNKIPNKDFYFIDVEIIDASIESTATMRFRHGFAPHIG